MNFFEILYVQKNGAALPANFFDLLFAKSFTPVIEWGEYDGALPAQYSANGSTLADYRVYGSAGGVGDVTAQLFDPNAKDTNNGYIAGKFLGYDNEILNPRVPREWAISEYISCSPNLTYVLKTIGNNTYPAICWYDDNYNFLSGTQYNLRETLTVSSPANAAYVRFSIYCLNMPKNSLTLSPAPESYAPYGYEVDMGVQSENLFDPSDTTPNYRYDDNGNWVNDNGVLSSGYMKVTAGDKYEYKFKTVAEKNIGLCRVNFINANGQWLSVNKVSFNTAIGDEVTISDTAPAGTAFIRTSQFNGELNISMIVAADTTPIYIGSDPLGGDEYVDYQAGKVYRRTEQVMPSAPAETKVQNGITIVCDGQGRYSLSGTSTNDATIDFSLPSFIIPVSVGQGGSGTFSLFNDIISGGMIYFLKSGVVVDSWNLNTANRINNSYSVMGGKKVDSIRFMIPSGKTISANIMPMFTDDGDYPSTYIPYLQPEDPPVPLPALPTVDGTNIVDYAGQSAAPSRFYAKYQKG